MKRDDFRSRRVIGVVMHIKFYVNLKFAIM